MMARNNGKRVGRQRKTGSINKREEEIPNSNRGNWCNDGENSEGEMEDKEKLGADNREEGAENQDHATKVGGNGVKSGVI